jgi:ureidoacrylate peracid hydrolase
MRVIQGIEVLTTLDELLDPKTTAIMCVDMQNANATEEGKFGAQVAPVRAIIPKIQSLLAAARSRGVLVTYAEYIQCNRDGVNLFDGPELWSSRDHPSVYLIREGTWEARTIDELAPRPGDVLFLKSRGSAFWETPLTSILNARHIRSLILTGTATSGCVFATWLDARERGFYPVLVTDAVAEPGGSRHQIALDWMASSAPTTTTDEILAIWSRHAT